jgi:tetratricopeptide (TPR) repeat protein
MTDTTKPSWGQAMLEEVVRAIQGSNHELAIRVACDALDRGFKHPLLLNLRAFAHEASREYELALADLQDALTLAPNDPSILNAVGLTLGRLSRPRDAIPYFERSALIDPQFTAAHFNSGWACEMIGEFDRAKQSYEIALAQKSDHCGAFAGLASLASRRADWKAARENAGHALAIDPSQTKAIFSLVEADLAIGEPDTAQQRLLKLVGKKDLSAFDRALMHGYLGDAYDVQGQYRMAFSSYASAAQCRIEAHKADFDREGIEPVHDYVHRITRYFRDTSQSLWKKAPTIEKLAGRPDTHVFLLGFARSGTTLLENVLASHPDISAIAEKPGLQGIREFLNDPDGMTRLCSLDAAAISLLRETYWRTLESMGQDIRKKIVVDKSPFSSMLLPVICRLFPEAKIILAVRDPRDVVFSCFRRRFLMSATTYEFTSLERAARFYNAVMTLALDVLSVAPIASHRFVYESFVKDFAHEARTICAFIGAHWNDDLLEFAELAKKRNITTPSSTQVVRGLYQDGVGVWSNYSEEIGPVLGILQPLVKQLGYD